MCVYTGLEGPTSGNSLVGSKMPTSYIKKSLIFRNLFFITSVNSISYKQAALGCDQCGNSYNYRMDLWASASLYVPSPGLQRRMDLFNSFTGQHINTDFSAVPSTTNTKSLSFALYLYLCIDLDLDPWQKKDKTIESLRRSDIDIA